MPAKPTEALLDVNVIIASVFADHVRHDEVVSEALREHQARRQGVEIVMTPELERLLDEGLENLDQSKTTDESRRRS